MRRLVMLGLGLACLAGALAAALPAPVELAAEQEAGSLPGVPVQHALLGKADKPVAVGDLDGVDSAALGDWLGGLMWADEPGNPAGAGQLAVSRLQVRNTLDQVLPCRVMVPGMWPEEMRLYVFVLRDGQPQHQVVVRRSGSSWPFGAPAGASLLLYVVSAVPGVQPPLLFETGDSTLAGFEARSWRVATLVALGFALAALLALLGLLHGFPAWVLAAAGLAWAALWTWLGYWSGSDAFGGALPEWIRDYRSLWLAAPGTGLFCAFVAAVLGRLELARFRFWAGFATVCLLLVLVVVVSGKQALAWQVLPVAEFVLLVPLAAGVLFRYGAMPGRQVRQVPLPVLFRLQAGLLAGVLGLWLFWPVSQLWLPVAGGLPGPALWLGVWLLAAAWILVQELVAGRQREARLGQLEELNREAEAVIKSSIQTIESQKAEIKRLGDHDSDSGFLRREAFVAALDREFERYLRYGTLFSLMVVELDGIRQLREGGDEVMDWANRFLFASVATVVRKSDLAGRYGDHAVAILLPETQAVPAMLAAEKIRARVQEGSLAAADRPAVLPAGLRCSLGVAAPRKAGQDLHRLLQELDDALGRAQAAGGNRAALSSHALDH